MKYVYILQSLAEPDRYYVGQTKYLRDRLKRHNAGEMTHTSKFAPWRINTFVAFSYELRANAFERYLKTASGRASSKKKR